MPDFEPSSRSRSRPSLGHGVGLRVPHYDLALARRLDVDFVEVVSENFFGAGGRPLRVLEAVREQMPIALHGVSLAVGSVDPPSPAYLDRLAELCHAFSPAIVSDHLCWGRVGSHNAHELLPLPLTEEALDHVVTAISRVQDRLGRRILLENVSSYVGFRQSTITEWEFLAEVSRRADSLILLDVNNVIVSAKNFGFDPHTYVRSLPAERIWQLHLANHSDRGRYKFDDHRGPVPEEVWRLYEFVLECVGDVPTIVEWDEDIPEWSVLREQQRTARAIAERASA